MGTSVLIASHISQSSRYKTFKDRVLYIYIICNLRVTDFHMSCNDCEWIPLYQQQWWLAGRRRVHLISLVINWPISQITTPQCTIQNRNVNISLPKGALWDMGQVHCAISDMVPLLGRWFIKASYIFFSVLLFTASLHRHTLTSWHGNAFWVNWPFVQGIQRSRMDSLNKGSVMWYLLSC